MLCSVFSVMLFDVMFLLCYDVCSNLLCSSDSVLFYHAYPLCFVLLSSDQFYCMTVLNVLFCSSTCSLRSVLFCSVLFSSLLLFSSILSCSNPHCSVQLYSGLFQLKKRNMFGYFRIFISDLLNGFIFMMTSPLFVLYLLSILFETLALLGQQSSLLRYVETQFRAPIYKANYFSGKNL